MTLNQQISRAEARCRKAWKPYAKKWYGKWAWCLHHATLCEPLALPPQKRIRYIVYEKPKPERVTRLNNFRPMRRVPETLRKSFVTGGRVYREYAASEASKKAHRRDVPRHTWNGESIF